MNAKLVSAALSVIPKPEMLVNVVRLRVRQLCLGHRPLVETIGFGLADIALTEIIQGKLTFDSSASTAVAAPQEVKVVKFPVASSTKKKA